MSDKAKLRVRTLKWDENQFLNLANDVRCVECVLLLVIGWWLYVQRRSVHCSFNIFSYIESESLEKIERDAHYHDHKSLTFMYPLRCALCICILFTLNLSIQSSDSRYTYVYSWINIYKRRSRNQTALKRVKIVLDFCVCQWPEIQIWKAQWMIQWWWVMNDYLHI